jgi:hypothetical protein
MIFRVSSVFLYSDDFVVRAGQDLHNVNPVTCQWLFRFYVEIIRKYYFTILMEEEMAYCGRSCRK